MLMNILRGLLITMGLGMAAWLWLSFRVLPGSAVADVPAEANLPRWPTPAVPSDTAWSAFQRMSVSPGTGRTALASRFRLAGTFYALGDAPDNAPRAILDDLEEKTQYLVREGEQTESFEVARIYPDRVVLRSQGQEYELRLSFLGEGDTGDETAKAEPSPAGETVLETCRFGKRVGEARWVFSDEALRAYYRELLDDPERLAALYLSMKPDYAEEGIDGYYLDVEGEADFFQDIGLQNGDVIRRVNSLKMTSQNRAEYFISEFAKSRLGAVVLDIEREGRPEKLIYMIR
jgi:type II secretion system protein C